MYSFVASDKIFSGYSTVYDVYNERDMFVTKLVVGYSTLHKFYYATEYKGADASSHTGIQTPEELATILYDFSQIFKYMDYDDIFSNILVYHDHQEEVPDISKKLLYIYDSSGEVTRQDGEWFIIAEDEHVEQLIYKNVIEGTELYLDEENDEGEIFVDLQEDVFYCNGETIDGFFARIYWDKIEELVLINNI